MLVSIQIYRKHYQELEDATHALGLHIDRIIDYDYQ